MLTERSRAREDFMRRGYGGACNGRKAPNQAHPFSGPHEWCKSPGYLIVGAFVEVSRRRPRLTKPGFASAGVVGPTTTGRPFAITTSAAPSGNALVRQSLVASVCAAH